MMLNVKELTKFEWAWFFGSVIAGFIGILIQDFYVFVLGWVSFIAFEISIYAERILEKQEKLK